MKTFRHDEPRFSRPATAGKPGQWYFSARDRVLKNVVTRLITFITLAVFWEAQTASGQNPDSIVFSKHNLSLSSPGTVRSTTESDICIFCHTPHQASNDGPLWNHKMSSETYTPYTSPTLKATVGQPTGSSRLCLSCHDGTVALGMVASRSSGIAMNSTTMPAGPSNLGTDLSADHPVSFEYKPEAGFLRDLSMLPQEIHMDRAGQMQCTACHDPHNNKFGNFLVLDNTDSALCLKCHIMPDWSGSAHQISTKALPTFLKSLMTAQSGSTKDKATAKTVSVAAAGCESCHVSHSAGTKKELMRFSTLEKNCRSCHDAEGPGQNVSAEFSKMSAHPISLDSESHTATEDPINPPTRHVTCADCHNPHASSSTPGSQGKIAGALNGVTGVSSGGSKMRNITHEYELCYRCHGDSNQRGPARVPRQFVETNTRREFNPGNVSFHPVETTGKNSSNASLLLPLTTASTIGCTDCHNNDQGPANGGTGTKGPHGSAFEPLIERPLLLTDGTAYNPANFALCYKCHSSAVVDSNLANSWAFHRKHIEDYRAACTTCHDSHAANQPHLINFNTEYVKPMTGVLNYTSNGINHGTCTLTCHDGTGQNKTHKALSY